MYSEGDLRQLLAGKTVGILGDSHARNLFVALVRLLSGERRGCALLYEQGPAWVAAADRWRWQCAKPLRRCACTVHFAGTLEAKVDELVKFWDNAGWDGDSASGAAAGAPNGGNLHVRFRWRTTLPPIAHDVRHM